MKTTAALQGQLEILASEDRPFLFDANPPTPEMPYFDNSSGQIRWPFGYANYGKNVAYRSSTKVYIKMGNDKAQPDSDFDHRLAIHTDIPPGLRIWGTASSRSGFDKNYFDNITRNGGIEILVQFQYSDASLRQVYTSGYCLDYMGSGVRRVRSVEECQDR